MYTYWRDAPALAIFAAGDQLLVVSTKNSSFVQLDASGCGEDAPGKPHGKCLNSQFSIKRQANDASSIAEKCFRVSNATRSFSRELSKRVWARAKSASL